MISMAACIHLAIGAPPLPPLFFSRTQLFPNPQKHLLAHNGSRNFTAFASKHGLLSLKSIFKSCQMCAGKGAIECPGSISGNLLPIERMLDEKASIAWVSALSSALSSWLICVQEAEASETIKLNVLYEVSELFELGIQLSYLLLLLALLGVGSFFVVRQVLVRRELDLSAKELQEQVRSGDASATELFELGAVMLRRKFYPAATKYLLQAIEKWDGDDQDLAQVYNALGVSYIRDDKLDKGIAQFETAVKLQPGYVTAWNNLGDAYEKKKDLQSALKAFEQVVLLDPNNKVARPRRDALKDRVTMYKGVTVKSKKR